MNLLQCMFNVAAEIMTDLLTAKLPDVKNNILSVGGLKFQVHRGYYTVARR